MSTVRGRPDLPPPPTGGEGRNFLLDHDLRGYLKTNEDAVTIISKPVSIQHLGALAA